MPLPTPDKDDSHDEFISKCISSEIMKDEYPDKDQRYAVCEKQWEKRNNMTNKRKVLFHLSTKLSKIRVNKEKFAEDEFDTYDAVMIVGDNTYNGVYFPKEELEKAVSSFEGKPVNINHNDDTIEDIVGYVKNVRYDNGKLRAITFFDKNTVKYDAVKGYMDSRVDAGDVPNVSIGVWLELEEEKLDDDSTRTIARNLEGDHLAVVVHGACNPEDGCGIGMSTFTSDNAITFTTRGYDLTSLLNNGKDELKINIENKNKLKKNIYKEMIKQERLKND